jgi:hypothetical protein
MRFITTSLTIFVVGLAFTFCSKNAKQSDSSKDLDSAKAAADLPPTFTDYTVSSRPEQSHPPY